MNADSARMISKFTQLFFICVYPRSSAVPNPFLLCALCASAVNSSVQFSSDDVETSQHRHHVGEHVAFEHLGQNLKMNERWRAGAGAPGAPAAVGDDVEAQFAV